MSYVQQQYQSILERIEQAKRFAKREDDIKLIAVSKQQPDDRVAAILEAGHKLFGENRVQEAQMRWHERFAEARKEIELHLIGPLQTNKAVQAVKLFDVIETLDREKLAKALVGAMDKTGKTPDVFVQVNTGEEPQKAGIYPQDLDIFIKTLRKNYDLQPKGLMCIPPIGSDNSGQASGPHFALLAKLAERNGIKNLSMGMSADFETAIAFGASHVRVGSSLFGARD